MKSIYFAPVLYLYDGTLLAYRYSVLYVIDPNTFKIIRKIPVQLGWKEKYLSSIKLIYRILRLGVRNAVQIDKANVLFFVNKRFYEVNMLNGILTEGFAPPMGMRALNITEVKDVNGFDDSLMFGAYFSPFNKRDVPIYRRINANEWEPVYSFQAGQVDHIHNIIPDRENKCLWILTGDFGDGAAIWMAKNNFKTVERIVSGSQDSRSCIAFPVKGKLVYATDSPFHPNSIRILEKVKDKWQSNKIMDISGSCIYGCLHGENFVFSTAVEPDGRQGGRLTLLSRKRGSGIADQYCHIYIGNIDKGFKEIYKAEKDFWPYPLCQFGTLRFASGNNNTNHLMVYHMATKQYDCSTISLKIENK